MTISPAVEVILSPDRKTMTIRRSSGHQSTLHSELPNGFTAEQVRMARNSHASSRQTGQTDRTFRHRLGRRELYIHINTGPPTWWRPRITLPTRGNERELSIGWLRILIAAALTTGTP